MRVTVWPAIGIQGEIMQFLPLEADANVPDSVLQCIKALAPQMPPFIPAKDDNVAVASDEVELVIQLQGAP